MLIIRIWNYFRGYVIIKIEGLTLEKFINLAIAKNILLWDISRLDYTTLKAKASISGFKALRDVVQKVGCRVSIIEKSGYPFFIRKFKYRKMFAMGLVISLTLVVFFTSFIWSIEITGNEKIRDEEIINALLSMNIKEGVRKSKADRLDIRNELLLKIQELSYANVEIHGTRMKIEVKERNLIQEEIKENVPCNIIASKKAVIERITVKNGQAVVSEKDVVKEGDVLISGIIKDERIESPLLVHSEGIVIGKVWYKETIKEPIKKSINEETGKKFIAREIILGDKIIGLMNGKIPFEKYIEEKMVKEIGDLGIIKIPLSVTLHIFKEVKLIEIEQDVDTLKKSIAVKATQQLMKGLPKESSVISKDVRYIIEDNILITEVIIEANENIGIKEKITTLGKQED